MIAVAIAGVVLGWGVHVRDLAIRDPDYAPAFAAIEAIGAGIAIAIASASRRVARILRDDKRYAARLCRDALPDRLAPSFAEVVARRDRG